MIRRASLFLVGALMGATAMSVIYSAGVPAEAAGSSTYKELSVFGDVFRRRRHILRTHTLEDIS
ncbi:peptidase S41, partial [Rhizobium ruizarguesonis]